MPFTSTQLAIPAALFGIALHLCFFIRGEHHQSNGQYFLLMVFGPPAVCFFFYLLTGQTWFRSMKDAFVLTESFAGSLTASIFVYRYFLHRLKKFHGPLGARLLKLWQVKKIISEYNTFGLLDELHSKYGDIVRTRPSELSIIDPDVVEAVYGLKTKCTKGVWYDMSLPITSLHQFRDRTLHDKIKRQGWDKAFSSKSIRTYDSKVIGFADELVDNLHSFAGKLCNVTTWFHFYSYDVMGSLGFGIYFNTLKTRGSHNFLKLLEEGTKALMTFGCIVYLCNLCTKVPGSMNPITNMKQCSERCVEERKLKTSAEPDILGHLIEAEGFFGDAKLDHELLLGDSRLVIIAGSDTTAAVLAYTSYHIAQDPLVASKVREELQDNHIRNDNSFSIPALQDLTYLDGVICEGLRPHPPVPGGVFRMTPPEGIQVGKHYIPGDVNILVPTYYLQRSPKNFVHPNSFIPERWSEKPELIIHKNTWMSFSAGVGNCIGKQLAMSEMRTVISKVLMEFDVRLAPHETGREIFAYEKDCFVALPGKLELCFIKRGQAN